MSGHMRGHRLLLAAYPPWFRERYGDELDALLDETGVGPGELVDVLAAAARAWVRPAFTGAPQEQRRLRLLSSVSTLWVSWCVAVVGSMATMRLLEDPPAPVPSLSGPGAQTLNTIASVAMLVTAALVLVAATPLGIAALRGSSRARRIVVGPVTCLVGVVVVPASLYFWARAHPETWTSTAWVTWVGVGWVALVLTTALWWTAAMPAALRAAAPPFASLRPPVLVGPVIAVALLVPTAVLVRVCWATGTYWGRTYAFLGWTWTAVVVAAAVVGVVTSLRGARALAGGPGTAEQP